MGEDQAAGAREVGGEKGCGRVRFCGGGIAEGFGHDAGFAEEESTGSS